MVHGQAMAGIFIVCPFTRATVATGQHASLVCMTETVAAGGRFRCSACNQVHTWSAEDAIVGDTKAHLRKDGAVSIAAD